MKYTPEQLQAMAKEFMAAYEANDPRWKIVLIRLRNEFGWLPEDSLERIQEMAQ
jgi:NADH:ubiquinone oxidoreductase subunit E